MPPFNPNIIVAIIKALAQLVPVLDKHRFGALMAVPYLPAALA